MGRQIDENYSRNQCALMIRVDGDEIYMPLNFAMRADEIREIYPYLLTMFNSTIANPSAQFQKDDAAGRYRHLTEEQRRSMLVTVKQLSNLWYNKAEESLLSIALRFAVDIKLRGIAELRHLFETVTPLSGAMYGHVAPSPANIAPGPGAYSAQAMSPGMIPGTGKDLTPEEVDHILTQHGLVNQTDKEFDPGDERDVPLGVAGDMNVDLYRSGAPEDYLSDQLDEMESKLSVQDTFRQTAEGTGPDITDEAYASKYQQGRKLTEAQVKGGVLNMYPGDEGSVFDALDREDGLDDARYDDDYRDYRTDPNEGPDVPAPAESDQDTGLPDEELPDDYSDIPPEAPVADDSDPEYDPFAGEGEEDEPEDVFPSEVPSDEPDEVPAEDPDGDVGEMPDEDEE